MGTGASVVTLANEPAIVLQGNFPGDCDNPAPGEDGCAGPQNNPAAVMITLGGLDIQVLGDPAWSSSQIEAIAGTLS
jgi:hypothetical protein